MLQRTILRLSKRKKEPLLFSENKKAIKVSYIRFKYQNIPNNFKKLFASYKVINIYKCYINFI